MKLALTATLTALVLLTPSAPLTAQSVAAQDRVAELQNRIKKLEQENAELRAGIQRMRNEMHQITARLQTQQRRAETEANKAEQVTQFLQATMKSADPTKAPKIVALEDVLQQARQKLEAAEIQDPAVQAKLRSTLAKTYSNLQRHEEALQLLQKNVASNRDTLGGSHPVTVESLNELGSTLTKVGRLQEAGAVLRETVEQSRELLGEDHPKTIDSLHRLAENLSAMGDLQAAAQLFRQAVESRQRSLGTDHPDTIAVHRNLALLYAQMGRLEEAAAVLESALARSTKVMGNHPLTRELQTDLARIMKMKGEAPALNTKKKKRRIY